MKTKIAIPEKAAKLLRRVKREILAKPNSYRQDVWNCGSAACIAGHAIALTIPSVRPLKDEDGDTYPSIDGCKLNEDWEDLANRVLGLDYDHFDGSLFTADPELDWPEPFAEEWRKAASREDKAKIAARRIDHFIHSGE